MKSVKSIFRFYGADIAELNGFPFQKWHHIIVRILDGNSETGAHARSNICYLICLKYLIRSGAVTI